MNRAPRVTLSSSIARTVLRIAAGIALVASPLLAAVTTPGVLAADPSFVTRQGQQLVLDGQPFRFTGMNIYAANSDGWCGEDYTADQLRTAFDGMGSRNTVLRSWFFQTLAAQKGPDGAWTGVRDWSRFDQTLAVAAEKGVRVIVTLTDQWGECGDGGHSGFKTKDWYLGGYNVPDPILTARYAHWVSYRDWVTEVVTRYKDDPTILAWQLINEGEVKDSLNAGCPVGDPDDPMDHGNILRDFAQDISGTIRGLDPNHLISLGTLGGGQCGTQDWQYSLVHALPNIDVCEVHDYSLATMPGDPWNGLQRRLDQCAALDKPLFIGETGITPNALPEASFEARAELFDAKFRTQFAAGVVGELVWAYRRTGSTLNTFDIGDGDPTLLRLQAWGPGCDPNDYRIAYTREQPRGGGGSADLWLLDPVTGAQRRITVDIDHGERQVAWSPDGQRLAYLINGGSFVGRTEMRTVNVDGTGVAHLTGSNTDPAFRPAWSPDGTQVAYIDILYLALMNADGTGSVRLAPTDPLEGQDSPSWAPDGSRIAFAAGYNGNGWIRTIEPDGTGLTTLSPDGALDLLPAWSPDGTRIAFLSNEFNNGEHRAELYVMDADGTGRLKLSGPLSNDSFYSFSRPAWTGPTGLVFSASDRNANSDLYTMNADGTGLTNLTNSVGTDEVDPAWRPTRVPPVICTPEPPLPTIPGAPLNVTASLGSGRDVLIDWDPPATDGGAELLDYRILANGVSVGGVSADRTSETLSNLPEGTYTFTVWTQNILGQGPESAPSGPVTLPTLSTPPDPPSDVVASAENGAATVTWSAGPSSTPDPGASPGPDLNGPITSYTVIASPGGATVTVPGTETSATVTGLANGTAYTFMVRATNDAGDGPWSSPSDPVTPFTVPDAPTGVAVGAGDAIAAVSWSPPAFDGGSPVTGYTVTASPGGQTATVGASATGASVSGLANGTAYTFTVVAANAGGDGAPSAAAGPVTPQVGALPPEAVTEPVPADTPTTVQTGTDATPADPLTTAVAVPATGGGGTVTITETTPNLTPPAGGYAFAGQQVNITSTAATSPTNPLSITFILDESALRAAYALGATDPLPAPETIDITRAAGAGSPTVIEPCTSTGGGVAIAPDPCVASRTYVGTDFQVTVLTSAASRWNVAISPVGVTASNAGFSPKQVTVVLGDGVQWSFAGRKHSVTNDQKLAPAQKPLFDSGPMSAGDRYGYAFVAAGTYTYRSTTPGDGNPTGSIRVPLLVAPTTGDASTSFLVTWASRSLPGYVFDVDVRFRRSGGSWSGWAPFRTGVTVPSATTTATLGAGTYELRARLRSATSNRASAWSPGSAVVVR